MFCFDLKLNSERNLLLVLVVINLIIKFTMLALSPVVNKDGALYLLCAQFISEGHLKHALNLFPYPLFPYLIAGTYKVLHSWKLAGYLLSTLPAAIAVVPFYEIVRNVGFDKKTALWSSLFFMCSPFPNEFSVWIGRDGLFWLLTLTSIALFTRAFFYSLSPKHWVSGLLVSCLAFALRLEGIVLLVIGFTGGLILVRKRRPGLLPLLVAMPVIAFVFTLLLPSDVKTHLRLNQLYDQLVSICNLEFLTNYRLIYNTLKEVQSGLPGGRWAENFIEVARHYMIVVYFIGLMESLVRVLNPFFAPFIIYGLVKSNDVLNNSGNLRIRKGPIWILFLTVVFILPPFWQLITRNYLSHRYVFIPAFLLFTFSGVGWLYLTRYIEANWFTHSRVMLFLLITMFFGGSLIYTAKRIYKIGHQNKIILKAVEDMKNKGVPGPHKYLSNDPRIVFYLSKKDTFLHLIDPNPSLAEKIFSQKGIKYVILTTSAKNMQDTLKDFNKFILIKKYLGKKLAVLVFSTSSYQENQLIH